MRRRLFIGSSSEHLDICTQIKEAVDDACKDWLDAEIWKDSGVFELNRGTLEMLVQAAREYDYGVFVAAEDDILRSRKLRKKVTRDNVLFEAGLFMGSLGLNRTFIVASSKVSLPSDFKGSTVIMYRGKGPGEKELSQLIDNLKGTKDRYQMDHMPSTSLAYGYYKGFIEPIIDILTQEGVNRFTVIVPRNISNLRVRIRNHSLNTCSKLVEKDNWHVHCVQQDDNLHYWDIPRSLRTLEGLIEYSKHRTDFGQGTNWDKWMECELDNFCDALQALLDNEGRGLYDKIVQIQRL